MAFYKVRPGQLLGHHGRTLEEGAIVELPPHVGLDVAEKVEPCTDTGEPLGHLSAEALVVAQARKHERESIIEQQIAELEARLADAKQRLADEKVTSVPPVKKTTK
jgi:hypothetical protein